MIFLICLSSRLKRYLLSKFYFSFRFLWHVTETLPCGLNDKLTGLISFFFFFSLLCMFSSPSVIQWYFSESFLRVLVPFLINGDHDCEQNYSRYYNFDKHGCFVVVVRFCLFVCFFVVLIL